MSEKMKRIKITLAAMTRVEYTEYVEVPEALSEQELYDLVEQRWDDVDGGEFVDDPDYWEKGNCTHELVVDSDVPSDEGQVKTFCKMGERFVFTYKNGDYDA
jgi:hypothetical protein